MLHLYKPGHIILFILPIDFFVPVMYNKDTEKERRVIEMTITVFVGYEDGIPVFITEESHEAN